MSPAARPPILAARTDLTAASAVWLLLPFCQDYTFDDAAPDTLEVACASTIPGGRYRPSTLGQGSRQAGSLAAVLAGASAQGQWVMTIKDNVAGGAPAAGAESWLALPLISSSVVHRCDFFSMNCALSRACPAHTDWGSFEYAELRLTSADGLFNVTYNNTVFTKFASLPTYGVIYEDAAAQRIVATNVQYNTSWCARGGDAKKWTRT